LPTSKPLKRLAADANVILSAIAGKAALQVFLRREIEIVTTQFNIDEVREYLSIIADKYDLSEKLLETQLKLLPLKVYSQDYYKYFLSRASEILYGRDKDDIELLALAMKLKVPIWSNDRDFNVSGLEVYTTAKLLKILRS
jgi:predicted nucleic acid-binding protein